MIEKIIFRNQVREHLITKMREGELNEGEVVSLAAMARELDVSVTPIREALTQLEQSNIIKSIPNRGFVVPELSTREAKNLYQLIAALEALAITNSTITPSLLKQLKKDAQRFSASSEGLARINTDMDFHKTLVSGYDNPVALQMIEDLKTRIFFYEKRFMEQQNQERSVQDHDTIISALENNQLDEAALTVQRNWLQILEIITLTNISL